MSPVKKHRVLAELSQQQLAQMSGISIYRIQQIEYGYGDRGKPKPHEIRSLSKTLNVSQKQLTEGE